MLKEVVSFWREHLIDYTYALAIVLGFFVLSRLVPLLLTRLFMRLSKKSKLDYAKLAQAFAKPLTLLLLFSGLYLAAIFLLGDTVWGLFFTKVFRSLVIVFIAQGLYNLVGSTSGLLMELGSNYDLDKLFLSLLSKALRAVIVAISLVILVQEWGYDITGFIAGLGLGGLAFALAAQDTAANLIGGVVILTEKPFTIGDWIVAGEVEGTVEDITFRSTKVRTFAQAVVTVPNSSLAKEPITNWTRMGRRRINFSLGIAWDTPREKFEGCVEAIRQMLRSHPHLHPAVILANFEKIGENSLDIYINCFTKSTALDQWLEVREDILFKIMGILEEHGVTLALPSRRVYADSFHSDKE
ncbi:MAG TPA: mechanosensitive ion channel protein [Firmicutes bacterium]|jgi:MscS family membrane protein|nr:mechanosensitive ion channel protein [Bacillota bacterium]HCX79888.1 mechanosensitive ion channel protein [Bacillota bacterium]